LFLYSYGDRVGRPRGFDEQVVTRAAVTLFAGRAYDGLSVDDLVNHLGVHRNSLYKTFGSKRGLYLTALRWHVEHEIGPLLADIASAADARQAMTIALTAGQAGTGLDLLLLAAVERAPVDAEVASVVAMALAGLDEALHRAQAAGGRCADGGAAVPAGVLTAELLGLRLRTRVGAADKGVPSATASRIGEALTG
jgi:TetR/AcrR family transcriptional repressor of nem operon